MLVSCTCSHSTYHVRIPHVILAEGPEGMVGLYLSELADITLDDLFRNSMLRAKLAAASILVLAVGPAKLVDGDGFILVGV